MFPMRHSTPANDRPAVAGRVIRPWLWMVAAILALALVLLAVEDARAQDARYDDLARPDPDNPSHIWRPAEAPDGAVSWTVLGSADEVEIEKDGAPWVAPSFPPQVEALRDQTVRVNGFMMPLQTKRDQSHFLLMAFPPDCPFCLTAGPDLLVEVMAAEPVRLQYEPLLVEGVLRLLDETDESGLFYRLEEGRAVN